ncbi:hypothetical protein LTR08_000101 [Meristemomyces frigidus]|nr:hypothetical protein LTR08_000101 [Meristemomyces frigidus]
MSSTSTLQTKPNGSAPPVGTAHTSRDSRSDLPSSRSSRSDLPSVNPNAWKRASSPVAEAYNDLVGRRGSGNIDEVLGSRKGGDRSSMSQYNSASKHRTQYYEDQFRYKDNEAGTVKERVQRESPVIAELKTNVIIKDEFTLVTDLSYHLAQRYTRPDSSIMIKVDHSACLALGGTFDPCYILTVTALPSQTSPTFNKRNAALIQSFMADILSVTSDRGIVKFVPIEECNYAMNGTTMLGEIERLEKHQSDENGVGGAVKRAVTSAGRKSMPAFVAGKKSMPKLEPEYKSPMTNAAPAPNGVTVSAVAPLSAIAPVERKRRSTTTSPPLEGFAPQLFELPATETERPSTAGGGYAAVNGLRMNGISKEDLIASAAKLPTGRPKTFAGHSPLSSSPVQNQSVNEPVPSVQRQASQSRHSSYQKPRQSEPSAKRAANIPISPKPAAASERRISGSHTHTTTPSQSKPYSESTTTSRSTQPKRDTHLDNAPSTPHTGTSSTHSPRPSTSTAAVRSDPKLDARAAERNRQMDSSIKDTAANTAKRRSTVTATPKMPPPPPVPESRGREPKGPSKRKSFLSAFRRS